MNRGEADQQVGTGNAGPSRTSRGWRRAVTRILLGLGFALAALAAVVVLRTFTFKSKQLRPPPPPATAVDGPAVAGRLGRAITFRTISHEPGTRPIDAAAFAGLHEFLAQAYPKAHAAMRREVIAGHSLLYTWEGSDPTLPPVLLLAHQDVVPAESPGSWAHDPFGGEVAGGAVWGRGAVDCKGPIVGIFEAVELLLSEGWRPRRTVLLAFGHDEEVGGGRGARVMAALLEQRGVRPAFVLDEGGCITDGIVPGVNRPVALVGIAEKGYLSLELSVTTDGGHSSMPPPQTAVGVLAAAVHRIERNPFPARLSGATRRTLEYLGPEMPFPRRLALANLWLFGPLVERQYLAAPATAAAVRTTAAATVFHGGVKENVLPAGATAVVNFRLLPGDSVEGVTARVRRVIDDARVEVRPTAHAASEPSPVSGTHTPGFAAVQRALAEVAPDAIVAPYLVLGGTDARHYARLAPSSVYRFTPVRMKAGDLEMIHGTNERMSLEDCALMVKFYARLLKNGA